VLIVKMTHQRPTVPGWYWAENRGGVPLQPVFVFNGGDGFGLLYTLERIREDEDDSDRDGKPMDIAHRSWLWSTEPIPMPEATQ
jgi:hypothetical protein